MAERTVTVRLRAIISDYQKALRTAAGDTQTASKNISRSFSQVNSDIAAFGSKLTRSITVPVVAAGGGALKLASDFETAFAQMVGLAGVQAGEIDGLRESVLKLGHETATSPQKLAEALYFIRSSGIDAAHAMSVLEASAKASAAGMGEPAVIARTLSAALNAYGPDALTAAHATDVLTAAIREGTFEPAELAGSLGTVIATASTMGISFDQLAGTLAVLSRTGLDASEASTSLNAILTTLRNTSKDGEAALAAHGLSLGQLRDVAAGPGGVIGVMRMLDTAFGDDEEALSTIIPNVRAFRGAMTILAQDAGSVDTVMRNVTNSTGAAGQAFDAVAKTRAFKLKQDIVDMQEALIAFGQQIAPIAAEFGAALARIAGGFAILPGPMKQVVVWLAIIAAAAGPLTTAFANLSRVAVPAIQIVMRAVQGLQVQLALARLEGLSTGQALKQMALGAAPAIAATTAIIGAGVAVIYAWSKAKADAKRRTQEFVTALQADNGALGANTEALIRNKLASADIGDNLTKAGITYDQFIAALNGTDEASAKVIKTLFEKGQLNGQELIDLGNLINAYRSAKTAQDNLAAAGAGATDAQKKEADAAAASAQAQIDAAFASMTQASALSALEAEATIAANSLQRLLSVLDATYASAFAVADAQQGFADSLTDVDTAARGSGGSTRDLTSQQRTLERATKDVTKAQEALAVAEANLAAARKGASPREKQDAALDVKDAQVGLAQAKRGVTDAQKKLVEERKKGKGGDVAGAQLDLKAAQNQLEHATLRLTDAQAAQNKVLHSGEEQSDNVTKALDDLEQAQSNVTDATDRQMDAERQLRSEGATGGPVADRARAIRGSYDQMVNSAKNWIQSLINEKRPTAEIIAALDDQSRAAQHYIDTVGDPDGKLQKFIDANDRLRLIFTDDKFMTNFSNWARILGGALGVTIPDFLGSDATGPTPGRAGGGWMAPGKTYRVGENGEEYVTVGGQPQYVTPKAQYQQKMTAALGAATYSHRAMTSVTPRPSAPDKLGKNAQLIALANSAPMTAASTGGSQNTSLDLTVRVEVEGDVVKSTNKLIRYARDIPGGLPIRIRADF